MPPKKKTISTTPTPTVAKKATDTPHLGLSPNEVSHIYKSLYDSVGVYMLEELIDHRKLYSVSGYHEYCRSTPEVKTVYEKTKDLLHIRIMAANIPDAIKWRLLAGLYPESYVVKKGVGEGDMGHDDFVLEM